MTAPAKPHFFSKGSGLKQGLDKNKGLENIFFTQSKREKFLDLLATPRTKNVPGQFHGIDLSHADLSHVDLSGTDLTGANLTNTNLTGAKLIGTNLTRAKLIRTIFCNANLAGVIVTDSVIDRTTQLSLQQGLNQQWIEAARKSIAHFDQKWEKLKGIEGFNAFETVLKRLPKNDITTSEIVEVITFVLHSPDICRLVFLAAQGADVRCYAHLLTIFNTAQGLVKFSKLFNSHGEDATPMHESAMTALSPNLSPASGREGRSEPLRDFHVNANANQQEILDLALSMIRQNLLDETTLPIMRQQWSEGRRVCNGEGTGPNVNEALEVQLALRHQLAAHLSLPFPIRNPMRATDIAKLNCSDKEFAIDFVHMHMSDQDQIIDALISLPVWQLYLERVLSKKLVQVELDETKQIAVDALLRQETEKILRAA